MQYFICLTAFQVAVALGRPVSCLSSLPSVLSAQAQIAAQAMLIFVFQRISPFLQQTASTSQQA